MDTALWICLLCLQGCVLAGALDCADADNGDCTGGQVAEVKVDSEPVVTPMRFRRQVDPSKTSHLKNLNRPGAVSVKGFPNTLIQADRSRRHLSLNKKKPKRKRIGSFSLLNHTHNMPIKVHRARRQTETSGPAADPLRSLVKERSKRNAAKKKKIPKKIVCS